MTVQEIKTMESIIEKFSSFSISGMDEKLKLEEMKKNFLEMLNNQFGYNGLMFEYGEALNINLRKNLPQLAIPNVNIVYRGNNEKIAYLDTRTKCLVNTWETKIDELQSEILQSKKSIRILENKAADLSSDYQRKRWNVFLQIFNRRKIKLIQYEIRDIKENMEKLKSLIEVQQEKLAYENSVKEQVMALAEHMKKFGINYRTA